MREIQALQGLDHSNTVRLISPPAPFLHDAPAHASSSVSSNVRCHSVSQVLRMVRGSVKVLAQFRARCRQRALLSVSVSTATSRNKTQLRCFDVFDCSSPRDTNERLMGFVLSHGPVLPGVKHLHDHVATTFRSKIPQHCFGTSGHFLPTD